MNDIAIDVKDVTIRFNLASEKIDNLKEYFVKLIFCLYCSLTFNDIGS